jgi:hypothetical protein
VRVQPARVALGVVGLAVGALGVLALREATLSTHDGVLPGSRVEVVVSARSEGAEHNQTLDELVEALLLTCRLEVISDLDEPIESLGDGRFRAVLIPSLDETNRRQFRGCVEDWTIDQLRADIVSFSELG